MSLADVIGQQQVASLLSNSLKQNRVSHAYIFSGPKGVGKAKMAVEFAKALNCENQSEDACGQCISCRRIEHMNHPDIMWLQPEGQSIKIEQIRKLQKDFHFRAVESKVKVLVIEQAEKMGKEAANSLLKFLEEPNSPMVAILLSEHPHQLLPTIRSRCQTVYFPPLNPSSIVEMLTKEGFKEKDIRLAAHITEDMEAVRQLLSDEQFAQMRNLVVQWSEDIEMQNVQPLLQIQGKIMKNDYFKENLPQFLDLLLIWYHDILNIKLNRKDHVLYQDDLDKLMKQALHLKEEQVIHKIEEILMTKRQISANVNLQLALERLVLSLWEG